MDVSLSGAGGGPRPSRTPGEEHYAAAQHGQHDHQAQQGELIRVQSWASTEAGEPARHDGGARQIGRVVHRIRLIPEEDRSVGDQIGVLWPGQDAAILAIVALSFSQPCSAFGSCRGAGAEAALIACTRP